MIRASRQRAVTFHGTSSSIEEAEVIEELVVVRKKRSVSELPDIPVKRSSSSIFSSYLSLRRRSEKSSSSSKRKNNNKSVPKKNKEIHPFDALIELPPSWSYRERRNGLADYWLVSRCQIQGLNILFKNLHKGRDANGNKL